MAAVVGSVAEGRQQQWGGYQLWIGCWQCAVCFPLFIAVHLTPYPCPTRRSVVFSQIWVEANVHVRAPVDAAQATATAGGPLRHLKHDMAGKTMTLAEFDAIAGPRVLKTHAPRHMFLATVPRDPPSLSPDPSPEPLAPGVKVIYVSRNAKDACTSAYYHAANPHRLGIPFDAWASIWMSGTSIWNVAERAWMDASYIGSFTFSVCGSTHMHTEKWLSVCGSTHMHTEKWHHSTANADP